MSNNQNIATKAVLPIDDSASNPSIAFGGGSPGSNSSGTGIYGDASQVKVSILGSDKATIDANGITGTFVGNVTGTASAVAGPVAATTLSASSTVSLNVAAKILVMNGSAAPVNGTTGLNVAGIGSLYVETTNGVLYIQTAVISSPVWVTVGSQT